MKVLPVVSTGTKILPKMVLELRTDDFILGCDGSSRYIAKL